MQVPFTNLRMQNQPLQSELLAEMLRVVEESAFAGGPFVEKFEGAFAAYCGTTHAVGVANGTDALWLALQAVGVGAGDEVITVSATFFATAEAISACGATPVFVDIDPITFTMDPRLIEEAITPRTKAILPVHLYGQMADMDPIVHVARRHGLAVVEDASQAHGATYKGRKAGSLGDIGCFSFYPTKNLGALGEAGAIVTSNPIYAHSSRVLRDHGQSAKYHHAVLGWNARMDGLQAAALRLKLNHLDNYNAKRRIHAAHYSARLANHPALAIPIEAPQRQHVYHIYAVRVPNHRDQVGGMLAAEGIGTSTHYPVPCHRQTPYRALHHRPLPITDRLSRECLSLPLYPELTRVQVERVCSALNCVLASTDLALV